MSLEAQKTRISGRIWQAIAQSGVDLSTLPRDQVESLVDKIADAVMLEFDALLGEMDAPGEDVSGAQAVMADVGPEAAAARRSVAAAPGQGDEEILWEGRPFMSLRERYVVTNQRVRIITGIVGRNNEDIEFIRMKDVDFHQGISERMLNIGDIELRSADPSHPNAVLRNVTDPAQVHEIIRRAMLDARKRYPFIFEQEM